MQQTAELRQSGIGGSDAGVILGLSKWKTPLQLYMEKRGELPMQPDNPAMKWGRLLEDEVAEEYSRTTGKKIRRVNDTIRHETATYMMAHLDRRIVGGGILEVKTAKREDGWGEPGTDEIPDTYIAQVMHYMAVTGDVFADVAVLIGGSDFRIYNVQRSEMFISALHTAEAKFWHCVQTGNQPEPVNLTDTALLYPRSNGKNVIADDESALMVAEYKRLSDLIKGAEKEQEELKMALQKFMNENEILTDATGKKIASWKSQESNRFDSKAFESDHPELAVQYRKMVPSRVFRI